jgi:hypothetical protein
MPGDATVWRQVAPGTEEYTLENVLMRVLAAHRTAQAAPP